MRMSEKPFLVDSLNSSVETLIIILKMTLFYRIIIKMMFFYRNIPCVCACHTYKLIGYMIKIQLLVCGSIHMITNGLKKGRVGNCT